LFGGDFTQRREEKKAGRRKESIFNLCNSDRVLALLALCAFPLSFLRAFA
jgi:hypothetical protein